MVPWARPRHEILLLVLVAVAALSPLSYYSPQDQSRLCLSQAISHGRLDNDRCLASSFDRARFGGHLYSDKAPGLSLLELPAAEIVRLPPAQHIPMFSLKMWLIRVTSSGVAFLVLAFLMGRLAEGLAPGYGGLALVTFALGTLVAPFAAVNFAELPAAALGFGAFLLMWKRRSLLAGALAGAAVVVEYQAALVLVVVGVYSALQGFRALSRYLAGAAPLLALLLLYGTLAFGRPWRTSYDYIANVLAGDQAKGLFGIGVPHLFGLYLVFSGGGGLLVLSPVLAAAAWGITVLSRRYRAEALVCGAVVVLYVVLDAGYFEPYGGISPGPRFVIPCLPFLCLGLGPAFGRRPRLTAALAVVSIVPTVAITMIWPANKPLRETIWGELARVPSELGKARFVSSLSENVIVRAGATPADGAILVAAAAIAALVLALVSSRRHGRRVAATDSRWSAVALAVLLCLTAVSTASAVFRFPYGSRTDGIAPATVDLVPSIAGTRTTASPGQEVDLTVYVDNPTRDTLTQVLLALKLSSGLKLLGPPFYERGSGCVGTRDLTCNLDFLEAHMSTLIRLGVAVTSTPGSTETVEATVDSEGLAAQRQARYTIHVGG